MKPHRFLTKVWSIQAQEGYYFCLSSKGVDGGRWRDHFFEWPFQIGELQKFFKNHPLDEYHLYFCPLPFREAIRRKELVIGSQLLWADLDEANPNQIDPIPQIAWESSPDRYSALWILDQFYTPLEIESKNKALTYTSGADKGGWDLTQVLRIPGTLNCKYKKKPLVKLLWFTDNIYTLDDIPEPIQLLDAKKVLKKYKKRLKASTLKLLTATRATKGKRSDVIWRLENELFEQGLSEDEIFTLIKNSVWNKFAGRRDEDRQLRREVNKLSDKHSRTRSGHKDKDEDKEIEEKAYLNNRVVRMADIAPEKVQWFWYPYIPRGKLTIVEGDPGLGKSWFTLALASHLSLRKRLPNQEKKIGGKSLLMSAEDGLADTIRNRLDSFKANVTKIFAWNGIITLDDEGLAEVEEEVIKYRPKLLIIDPLVAYMGGSIDLHKANETRVFTSALSSLAERYGIAIVAIRHLRKGNAEKSIYRGIGSIDILGSARSVLMIGHDPHDASMRIICHIKSNLAPQGQSLKYKIDGHKARPFRWMGTSDLTAEEVLSAKPEQAGGGVPEISIAIELLIQLLSGTDMLKDEVEVAAESKGISIRVLNRARRRLKVRSIYVKDKVYWTKLDPDAATNID